MKRNFIFFTSLFFFLSAFLQINAQKVRVIDNKGTLKSLNRVTVGNTPHTEPTEGDIWFDTSATSFDSGLTREHELKIYNDGSWIKLSENIYNADGKLTYHRTIRGSGNDLTFEDIKQYRLNARKIDFNSYIQPITLNPVQYNNSSADPVNYGIIAEGPFWGKKAFRDSSGDVGTNGQILSSVLLGTEQGTNWIDAPTSINTTITNTVVGNKIADYTSENGTVTPINETITSISQSASNTNTQVAANTANTIATYTNENGSNTTINETVTSLSFRTITGGSPTVNTYFIDYLDEKGTTNSIDVSGLVYKGTPGSVLFAGKNGMIAEDNNHLFWDIDEERLYIGAKLSGNNKLNVSGTTRTQGINNSNGSTTRPSYRFTEDSNTGIFRPSADNLAFATGGTETIRINASQDVGIGTTTPTEKLDIDGKLRVRNVEDITSTGLSVGDKIVIIDANGVVKKISGSFHTIGDIKYSVQTANHNGWYLLNGQTVTGIAATNATTLGISSTLPDATDKVLKHSKTGESIFSTGGNPTTTLNTLNIPQLTGATTLNGNHNHSISDINRRDMLAIHYPSPTGLFYGISGNNSTNLQTDDDGAHSHNVTVNIGNTTPQSFENYQPYLVVNTFIYLGL